MNQADDSTGPLEARNKHIEKEISDVVQDIDNMKKEWFNDQTQLVKF